MTLTDRKITILGAQRSGQALAKMVTRLGGKAKISDQRPADKISKEFIQWALENTVTCEFGGHTQGFIEDSSIVVLSPGVSVYSQSVPWARDKNIPVLGEIEFAAQFCSKPVIAVTGSNGKTTVTTLIHKILEQAGYKSCLCGNIGFPFSDYVLDSDKMDFFVLEVSSFQLESILDPSAQIKDGLTGEPLKARGFKPRIAVILNFSQNHLDRHKDLQEYFDAKKRIFLNQDGQDYAVLNARDGSSPEFASNIKSQVVYFDPVREGMKNPNYIVASQVATILGIDPKVCAGVFEKFKGVEHRLEWIRQVNGVDFINDSKSTTAQASVWALERLDPPVIMICGGRDKHIDFSVLKPLVRRKVKRMITIGEAKAKIKETFQDTVEVEQCDTLEDAVFRARKESVGGDTVLLSPMCASFDMFLNYEHRGRVFKGIVNTLG